MSNNYYDIFCQTYKMNKDVKFAFYGTGLITQTILKENKDFQVECIFDRMLVDGEMNGIRIVPMCTWEEYDIDILIIAAQARNIRTIYARIYPMIGESEIKIYDIYGEDLRKKMEVPDCILGEENCYLEDEERLRKQIDEHSIISFDVFDTLVMRKTYEPHDVFRIVENRAKRKGMPDIDFYNNRIRAEVNLLSYIPTIYEIYDEVQRLTGIADEIKQDFCKLELEIENEVIIPRNKMIEIMEYAYEQGKDIYIISDMYIPKRELEEILRNKGIVHYIDLYDSCEFHKPKVNGLYEIFKDNIQGDNYLHIGDHEYADYECAKANGIDSFLIEKGTGIFEKSKMTYNKNYSCSWNEKLVLGLIVAKMFNNPFCVTKDKKIVVGDIMQLGYSIIGSVITAFVEWMKSFVGDKQVQVLLGARDGYILDKLLQDDERYQYFYTSRIACLFGMNEAEFMNTPLECFSDKMNNYKKYMEKKGIDIKQKMYFVDFASSGTCLKYLKDNLELDLEGIFVYTYKTANRENLKINSFFSEEKAINFWQHYLFFETVVTSLEGTVKEFDKDGNPVFERDPRGKKEKEYVQQMHEEIIGFYRDYKNLSEGQLVSEEFVDMCIGYMNNECIVIKDERKDMIFLYDEYDESNVISVFNEQ